MLDRRLLRAQTLFDELIQAPAERRSSLLAASCSDDVELCRLVGRLLENDDSGMVGFLTHPILARPQSPASPPPRIGRYEIIREIGRGGAGVVYEARQDQPARVVALKVLSAGIASAEMLRRFEHEAEILGSLTHPGIAKIFEAGATELSDPLGSSTTVPYFAMERVDGLPITSFCDRETLDIRGRLALFVQVCRAVQHAHTKGVIHRDIKPTNVLAGAEAGRSFCRVIDFGIAKLVQPLRSDDPTLTQVRQLAGTPEYMSSEQAAGSRDIDTRTDVYSLGVLLYELLTGTTPFGRAALRRASLEEICRIIRDEEPQRPSARLEEEGTKARRHLGTKAEKGAEANGPKSHRASGPACISASELAGELDWIVLRTLEKDRARRYDSAGSLADDVERFLAGHAIEAAPPSAAYRLRKFVRRNRAAVIAGVAVAAALLAVAGVSIAFGIRESRLRRDSELAQVRALAAESQTRAKAHDLEQVTRFQESQLASIDPQKMGAQVRRALLEKARAAAGRSKLASAELDARAIKLEELIAGSDFTGIALETLSGNFFTPARAAIEKDFADQPLVKARLLQSLATTLEEIGLLDAASAPQQEALSIRRRILGDEHRDTLHSLIGAGLLALSQGKLPEAEAGFRQALDISRRVLGEDDPVTLSALGSLGVVLRQEGKTTEAESYSRSVLEKSRRVLGEEDPETLKSITNLGTLLMTQNRYDDAEPVLREALAQSRRVLGDEHQYTLTAINNLGGLLQARGEFTAAEPYYRESLEIARRTLGNDHPDTLRFINNLGFLLFSQQQLTEAERYYREALETRRRVLGDEHQATLNSLNNLGGCLKEQGRFDEAEQCYRVALAGRRRVLEEDHPDVINSLNNMGWLFEAQGRLDEAEPYYRLALEKHKRVLGPTHASTLISIANMSSLLLAQGKPAEAAALLAPAESAVRTQFTGASRVRLGRFLAVLGRTRVAAGEFEEAEANLREAYAILRDAVGATDQHRREVCKSLADLYDGWNSASPDKGYGAQAAEWRAKAESTATQPAHP